MLYAIGLGLFNHAAIKILQPHQLSQTGVLTCLKVQNTHFVVRLVVLRLHDVYKSDIYKTHGCIYNYVGDHEFQVISTTKSS